MILDSEDLIEKIIKELRTINGELMISKSIHNVDDTPNPKTLEELMEFIILEAKSTQDLFQLSAYLHGKHDAYLKMLDFLGYKYVKDDI